MKMSIDIQESQPFGDQDDSTCAWMNQPGVKVYDLCPLFYRIEGVDCYTIDIKRGFPVRYRLQDGSMGIWDADLSSVVEANREFRLCVTGNPAYLPVREFDLLYGEQSAQERPEPEMLGQRGVCKPRKLRKAEDE